jgi:RNA polymerase sigma-70 factor, ECF subfamily
MRHAAVQCIVRYDCPVTQEFQFFGCARLVAVRDMVDGGLMENGGSHRTSLSAVEFGEMLRRHQSQLFGYIHSLVRDLNDADDLFQQVALILWRKVAEFDRARDFLAWACGIARFEVLNFLRTRSRSRLYFSDELNLLLIDAQVEMSHDETESRREALGQCMSRLRDRDRQLLEQCYSGDGGVHALAQGMGRSSQSIYNSLRRIRRALFECVRRTLNQESHPGVVE